jgi:AbrB family looped-hinge helix DNA binding protein
MTTTSPTKRLKPQRVRLDQAGRIVLPARFRKSLRLSPGDAVTVTLDKNTLRISTAKSALDKAQLVMRQRNPARRSAVAALIAERRAEAARE